MIETIEKNLPLWHFTKLQSQVGIEHYVSGRRGGISSGEKGSLNLSYLVGDTLENVKSNRARISSRFNIDESKLVFPVQTHSVNIGVVSTTTIQKFEDTDALITNVPGILISVMSADCVPVILFDPVNRVVAAIHAGWKGTVGKIAAKAAEKMMKEFTSLPENIIACIGPSISPEIYEVGQEVINAVENSFGSKKDLIYNETTEGKGYFNLWNANKLQLMQLGLKEENIEVSGICTYKNSNEFFSARKSKNQAGRFAAGIMLC